MKHNLGEKEVRTTYVGVHREDLVAWVSNREEINNFRGVVEMTEDELNELVPEGFICSTYDDESQMNWINYCGHESVDTFIKSVNDGKYLVPIGKRIRPYYNRFKPVMSDEFYTWVDYFGIDRIHTLSESMNLIKVENIEEIEG